MIREKGAWASHPANSCFHHECGGWRGLRAGPSNAGLGTSLVIQMVKNLPAVWDTQVQSLDRQDPLATEDPLATHSSILAWRIPWTKEPGGL